MSNTIYDSIEYMNTIIIPRELASKDDLIVISRKEYEALLNLKKFKEFKPTTAQRKALLQAEGNFSQGKTLSHNELVKKLGFTN